MYCFKGNNQNHEAEPVVYFTELWYKVLSNLLMSWSVFEFFPTYCSAICIIAFSNGSVLKIV